MGKKKKNKPVVTISSDLESSSSEHSSKRQNKTKTLKQNAKNLDKKKEKKNENNRKEKRKMPINHHTDVVQQQQHTQHKKERNNTKEIYVHERNEKRDARIKEQWKASQKGANISSSRFKLPKVNSTDVVITEHEMDIEELLKKLHTDIDKGLTSEQHATILSRDGPNKLTPPKKIPAIVKLAKQLFGGFAMLLWIGAFLCIIGFAINQDQSNIYLAVVLVIVIIVTGCFSYYQEAKSAKVMEGFKALTEQPAHVIRDGKEVATINSSDLVVGDIVLIRGGDKLPADIRILKASSFKVDNSSLTGESEPQTRTPECTDSNPLETENIAFFSTNATEGNATGLVIATGDQTMIGKIAGLASSTRTVKTPISKEIQHFIRIITVIAIMLGVIFFCIGLLFIDPGSNLAFAIGIIVANVPEGLLATVTVALTLTSKRMARKNVLVKNLEAVETLGSTTTICSDKTGTLTQNRMTVSHLGFDGNIFNAGATNVDKDYDENSATFAALLQCATLCNNAVFVTEEEEATKNIPIPLRTTNGDASETALIKFAEPILNGIPTLGSVSLYRKKIPTDSTRSIPFNSTNKFQVSIHSTGISSKPWILLMKGAPERILQRCSHVRIEGDVIELTEKWAESYTVMCEELAACGERVLGFCHFELDVKQFPPDFTFNITSESHFPELNGMVLLGVMSMIDPPRAGVPGAVKTCSSAGIKVIMVTGDHPATAKAIAKKVNIITKPTIEDIAKKRGIPVDTIDIQSVEAVVVTGQQLVSLSNTQLDQILKNKEIVFARTSPQQKLRIVEGCQRIKEIVAVTGDGVNDSPALKKADIGVAMGITGSDVSKEAADMILLDDNFASIVRGIEEGRLIFDNLKKSIAYTLSSNIPEIMPFLLFILLQIPLPLTTVLILAIDVGTDLIPAISLAYENAETDIMRRKPRNAQVDRLVTTKLMSFSYLQIGVIQACAGMYTYFVVMADYGFPFSYLLFNVEEYYSDDNISVNGNPPRDLSYREQVLRQAQTAYFVSIVITQIPDILICKTRRNSLVYQGMTNWMLNFGICTEIALAIVVVYTPILQIPLGSEPLRLVHWFPAIPFSFLIFFYDETRKFLMRRGGSISWLSGWIERNTYY